MLAVLVAMALLVAPVAAVHARPCLERTSDQHAVSAEGLQPEVASSRDAAQGDFHTNGHQACCSNACGVSAPATGDASAIDVVLAGVGQHFARYDQVARGLAIPPTLAPLEPWPDPA
ncbi:hypothetical protein D3874_11030 [Oleomonas cavernae]|uniref:DUF2946 domain-containing protein n=1 Tax=Oleomonas cavernae TaxID=2320859 RepID=A0A418WBR9_9PROT|nr:hypothetical protein [Oleomonas cavernae]RJF87483.1 hypothetical protein D3874_11030 [Oleomonas cavernae]